MPQLAFAANVIMSVAKFMAYVYSGSSAMFSEAVHSLVDCVNQVLLMKGLQAAVAAPDSSHPYGYGAKRGHSFGQLLTVTVYLRVMGDVLEVGNGEQAQRRLEASVVKSRTGTDCST